MNKPWITIIGINHDDTSTLNKFAIKALNESEIIFGAKRHLKTVKEFKTKCHTLLIPLEKTIQELKKNKGKKNCIIGFW